MLPKGFCIETDHILLEQHSSIVTQTLWVGEDPGIFSITQRWYNGEEATVFFLLHELEELVRAACHGASRSASIQRHEDYLDAMDRHDDATM